MARQCALDLGCAETTIWNNLRQLRYIGMIDVDPGNSVELSVIGRAIATEVKP